MTDGGFVQPKALPRPASTLRRLTALLWAASVLLAFAAVLFAAYSIYSFATNDFLYYGPHLAYANGPHLAYEKARFARHSLLIFAVICSASCVLFLASRVRPRVHYSVVTELQAGSLSERAKQATSSLQEATTLVHELTQELTARSALLEDVKRQVAEAKQRAEDMDKLAQVDEKTTRILNKYFDEALARRLNDVESGSRRREWLLGTVGAVAFGLIAILVAHFVGI